MMHRPLFAAIAWLGLATFALAQGIPPTDLPRRSSLGVGFATDTSAGLSIASVRAGGPAEQAGVRIGDRLLAIDRETVSSPTDVLARLRTKELGSLITLSVERDGKPTTLAALLDALPSEVVPGSTVTYGAVTLPGGYRLRTIVTLPENLAAKAPLFVFIQGMPCESIDRPLVTDAPDTRLVHAMASAGFATLRVDKAGCGDSEGPPCGALGFTEEALGPRVAIEQLRRDPRIDGDRIYVFGHSLGGVIAAELARQTSIRGTVVFGTVARTWLEFMLDSVRRQTKLAGASESETSAAVAAQTRLLAPVLFENRTFGEVVAREPDLEPLHPDADPMRLGGRHLSLYRELQALNIANSWESGAANVLAIHGEYDVVTTRADAEAIAAIVSAKGKGVGRFLELPLTDHGLMMHDSFAASRTGPGRFSAGLVAAVRSFIAEVEGGATQATLSKGEQPAAPAGSSGRDALPSTLASWTRLLTEAYPGKQDDVFFVDSKIGFYCNGAGKIWKTIDSGQTWALKLHQPGTYFRCLTFLDAKVGFAGNIGPGYFPNVTDAVPLYRTSDGGETWSAVTTIAGDPVVGLCALEVIKTPYINAGQLDYRTKIVGVGRVGGPTAFIESRDLGQTWQRRALPDTAAMAFDVHFFDDHHGILASASDVDVRMSRARLLATDDGGATWKVVYTGERAFELTWKVSFPTREIGYATIQSYDPDPSNAQRLVAKTEDGGKTWFELPLVVDHSVREFGVAFVTPEHGFVGAVPGGFETLDGGRNWARVEFGNAVNKIRILRDGKDVVLHAIGRELWTKTLSDPLPAK